MTCPICKKPTTAEARPFCSKRCADLDLARWFNGSYAVPSNDPEDLDTLDQAMSEAQEDAKPDRKH